MDEFEAWYRKERPRVLAACVALSGDLEAAREATDEAFTRALERWARVAAMAAPGGWTQTVALNYLRRRLRLSARERLGAACPPPMMDSVPDRDLWMAVASLASRQQMVIVLRYVHDLSYSDIAATLGISAGAVGSCLHTARSRLAELLGDDVLTRGGVDG